MWKFLRAPGTAAVRRIAYQSLALSVLAAMLVPPGARAQLTLAEAQRFAVERSRQLAARDAGISASREMAVAAARLPDPVLRLGIENLPIDGADRYSIARDFMTMRRVGVMQEFTRGDKRRLGSERFERETERAMAEKTAAVATIQRDTALAWLNRYYLERVRAIVESQAREAMLEIEAAEGAYRAGRGSQADIHAARASRVALDDRLSEIGGRLRNAGTQLARWVGEAADAPLAGEPALDVIRINAHAPERELERHPELAALERQIALAETEAALARANRQSDWSVEVAYSQRGSAYSNMLSVGVSVPLQWDQKRRQDRDVAAKLALAEQARNQRDEVLRSHAAEVRVMINEWENGRERLARYRRELIPLARDRTQAALAAYRGGKGELNAALAARRNEIDVRMQAVQIEMDTARAWAQINSLIPDGVHESAPPAASRPGEAK